LNPFVLDFGGAVRGIAGTSKVAVYSGNMVVVMENEPWQTTVSKRRFGKIWIDEKFRLTVEVKDEKYFIRPVEDDGPETTDIDGLWNMAADKHTWKEKEPNGVLGGGMG